MTLKCLIWHYYKVSLLIMLTNTIFEYIYLHLYIYMILNTLQVHIQYNQMHYFYEACDKITFMFLSKVVYY